LLCALHGTGIASLQRLIDARRAPRRSVQSFKKSCPLVRTLRREIFTMAKKLSRGKDKNGLPIPPSKEELQAARRENQGKVSISPSPAAPESTDVIRVEEQHDDVPEAVADEYVAPDMPLEESAPPPSSRKAASKSSKPADQNEKRSKHSESDQEKSRRKGGHKTESKR
jgi:hypothetical protein